MRKHKLGIYEKALPKHISWQDRLSIAKACGFDFVEISIDESDERLSRLDWTKAQRLELVQAIINTGVTIPSMCLSGHRRFPFGSHDEATRQKAYEIMEKAIQLAVDVGIRTIQLAGYDVYYEEQDEGTLERFQQGMEWAVELAASNQVTLSMEIMDTQFMSSITRWKKWDDIIR
ncbi:L-ribulose-5-phosphate 3-epimerase, partial [Avibacterium avium]|uniref:L-ribulose-5-phosphate 3-epimerase n=1 Tax=Avibacterium avium TaxID=751 RepID=UPI003BF80F70